MKLFEQFQPVTKEEWLQKVTTDLKGKKDIEDLSTAQVGTKVVSPFYHRDDITYQIDIPDSYNTQAMLGVRITIEDEERGNQLILESLEGGVSFLYLNVKKTAVDFNILFKGVLLDLITVVLQLEDNSDIASCETYINKEYGAPPAGFSIKGDSSHVIETENSIISALQSFLKNASLILSSNEHNNPIFFQLPVGHNYIENICAIRATRLLWANLLEAHGHPFDGIPLHVQCEVSLEILSEVQYDNMISLTQIAMSAMSGGADIIMLPPSDVLSNFEGKEETRRISRNIYNLITMEAHMHRVQSPTDGSYLFDKVSAELARDNWKEFITKQEA